MPSLPELSGIAGLVRRIEILRQIEAHQHRNSGGDVRVPGKVGIDLKGVAEQCRKVLKASVKQRVFEDPVAKIHSQIVTQNQLLGQSVQNPENRDSELSAAKEERLVKLREKLLGTNDRACHQLREETQIESEIPEVLYRADCPARNIHHIAYRLEDEERDSDRQEDGVHIERLRSRQLVAHGRKPVFHNKFRSEEVVYDICQEIGVLVVAQKRQVHDRTQHHNRLAPEGLPHSAQNKSRQIVIDNHKAEQNQEQSARLVVKEKTDEEQESVAQQHLVPEHAQKGQHNGEERPEIELGEQQRVSLVKREQVLEKISGNVPKSHYRLVFK